MSTLLPITGIDALCQPDSSISSQSSLPLKKYSPIVETCRFSIRKENCILEFLPGEAIRLILFALFQ